MKNLFATILILSAGVQAADAIRLDVQLSPDMEKQFQCRWQSKVPLTFWIGEMRDERKEKEIGWLLTKKETTPVLAQKEITSLLKEAFEQYTKKCLFSISYNENSRILLSGILQSFGGSSKKGLTKGEAKGRAQLTLNLQDTEKNDNFSVSFEVEEAQTKGISKNPKKLNGILNNLLTRLVLSAFESGQVSEWIAMR